MEIIISTLFTREKIFCCVSFLASLLYVFVVLKAFGNGDDDDDEEV